MQILLISKKHPISKTCKAMILFPQQTFTLYLLARLLHLHFYERMPLKKKTSCGCLKKNISCSCFDLENL